jgi:N utilization substance protein B
MSEVKKRSRREEREEIIKKLYEMDINNGDLDEEMESLFIGESLNGVKDHLVKIDEVIVANLTNWSIKRLTYVDRAIIRFATYELLFTETPFEIVINEALNITRKYSDEGNDKTVGFNNKVIDNIRKYLKK